MSWLSFLQAFGEQNVFVWSEICQSPQWRSAAMQSFFRRLWGRKPTKRWAWHFRSQNKPWALSLSLPPHATIVLCQILSLPATARHEHFQFVPPACRSSNTTCNQHVVSVCFHGLLRDVNRQLHSTIRTSRIHWSHVPPCEEAMSQNEHHLAGIGHNS